MLGGNLMEGAIKPTLKLMFSPYLKNKIQTSATSSNTSLSPSLLLWSWYLWFIPYASDGNVDDLEQEYEAALGGLSKDEDQNTLKAEDYTGKFLSWIMGIYLLGTPLWLVCGLTKFVRAVAYHFCLNLPATFSQPLTCHKGVPSMIQSEVPTKQSQAIFQPYTESLSHLRKLLPKSCRRPLPA